MIRSTLFAAAAALALSAGVASAQTLTQADVGSFVRDQSGMAIGSLQALDGNQATVHLGFFNTPGNHLVTVPAGEIGNSGGRLVLNDVPASEVASGW